ncbi:MAG: immunoglobulin domain-containing protein [Solirubrobacteraceae bacterium]
MAGSAEAAGSYGETLRFNGLGTGATKGHKFELEEETHAFGVDPSDNSIYVGDEKAGEEQYRLQKYLPTGVYEGEALLKPGLKLPNGIANVEDLDGVAVDSSNHLVYLLVSYKREFSDTVDPGKEVAGAVYAFKTTPEGGKLIPAPEASPTTGLLGTVETLKSNSETQGQALLEPSGITVDPVTHEIMILGEVDKGGGSTGLHVALERLSEKGTLGTTYVDPESLRAEKEPDSPVVSAGGTVFFENADAIQQVPANFTSAPKTVFLLEEPESLVEGPFKGELTEFGEDAAESFYGGGLAIISEGANKGRLVLDAEVHEMQEDGTLGGLSTAVLSLDYTESGEQVTVSEEGWVGGKPGELGTANSCLIGFAGNYPQVAAASARQIYVLAPSTGEVIELGPGGKACPTAKAAPSGLEATILGKKVSNVSTTSKVVLSAKIIQASVLSVEWKFGDGTPTHTTTVPAGEQTQTAEVEHTFAKAGKLTVEAIIHTDNLATPELTVSTVLNVEPPAGGPKVTSQPSSQTVVEGQSATFKAAASGEPTPTVQWEESKDGVTWTPVGSGTSGGTTGTLTVTSTTASENGREYRAMFKNSVVPEGVPSNAATLTVETKAEHEAKEKAEREAKEKAEREAKEKAQKEKEQSERAAKERAEAEAQAAAKKAQEEAAAKKAQEEAAKKAQEEASHKGVLPFTEGSPEAKLAGSSLTVSSAGAVTIKVSCPTGVSSCTGTVVLRTLGAVKASARLAKASILTLASGSFTVAGGQTKTITLHLSSKAKKLLAHSHSLKARATVSAHDPAGGAHTAVSTVTLRSAKHH